jgi:hypothetical protein
MRCSKKSALELSKMYSTVDQRFHCLLPSSSIGTAAVRLAPTRSREMRSP